jgi:hypothetical protein
MSIMRNVRVLLLEPLIVGFGVPRPCGVHFLEGTLVRLWVRGPDDRDVQGVGDEERLPWESSELRLRRVQAAVWLKAALSPSPTVSYPTNRSR